MRFHRLVLVAGALAMLLPATSRTRAQQPPSSGAAQPLTMGRLALMSAASDDALVPRLRDALRSSDAGLRAIAARIVGVRRLTSLEPDLVAALAQEQDDGVAAEMIRTGLQFDTVATRSSVSDHLPHAGTASLLSYAEHLGRIEPDRLADELPDLLSRLTGIGYDLDDVVLMAAEQHPDRRERLLRAWLTHASGVDWRVLLTRFDTPPNSATDNRILVDALASDDAAIRRATVWQIVRWLPDEPTVDAAVLAAAAAFTETSLDGWEGVGRELVRRSRGSTPTDQSSVLEQLGHTYAGDLTAAAGLPWWSTAEQRVVRSIVGRSASKKSETRSTFSRAKMATMRAVEPPWPGFLASLFDAARCARTSEPTYGGLILRYRPDGRPISVSLDAGSLDSRCQAALGALPALMEIERVAAVPADAQQWIVMTTQEDVVACVDTSDPRARSTRELAEDQIVLDDPRRVHSVQPTYPTDARRRRIQGTVVIESLISSMGCLRGARVVTSAGLPLDLEALLAVTQWRYRTPKLNGRPVQVEMSAYVSFVL
jgi:TonB family protein